VKGANNLSGLGSHHPVIFKPRKTARGSTKFRAHFQNCPLFIKRKNKSKVSIFRYITTCSSVKNHTIFRRKISPPSSGYENIPKKTKMQKKKTRNCHEDGSKKGRLHIGILLGLLFVGEHGGYVLLVNFG
jgi:hypothetical protein